MGKQINPIMPMSWDNGSQLTNTSRSMSMSTPALIATVFAARFPWLISTAFGMPVDPEVSCRNAISASSASSGSIGPAPRIDSTVQTATSWAAR